MFDFLEGTIEAKETDHLVLRTGGIGWSIAIPLKASQAGNLGDELKLFLHLAVGDNSFSLYGFPSAPERALFRKLLGVGGIGPMSALSLLSALGPDGLSRAIIEENTDLICSVKGVGKKTAERLLVDLRDSLSLPSSTKTGEPATAGDLASPPPPGAPSAPGARPPGPAGPAWAGPHFDANGTSEWAT